MANNNIFTVEHRGDWGQFSILLGTLAMDDGSAGSAAVTGMRHAYIALCNSDTNAQRITCAASGTIAMVSAASGVSAKVVIIGE